MCVQEALEELVTWLDAHPKEILIVSCSHFDLLHHRDHTRLVEYIISLFGKKLCSPQVVRLEERQGNVSQNTVMIW